MTLLSEHDGVLEVEVQQDDHLAVARLVERVLDVVVQNVHLEMFVTFTTGCTDKVFLIKSRALRFYYNQKWPWHLPFKKVEPRFEPIPGVPQWSST